jgi:hypothetical protein
MAEQRAREWTRKEKHGQDGEWRTDTGIAAKQARTRATRRGASSCLRCPWESVMSKRESRRQSCFSARSSTSSSNGRSGASKSHVLTRASHRRHGQHVHPARLHHRGEIAELRSLASRRALLEMQACSWRACELLQPVLTRIALRSTSSSSARPSAPRATRGGTRCVRMRVSLSVLALADRERPG